MAIEAESSGDTANDPNSPRASHELGSRELGLRRARRIQIFRLWLLSGEPHDVQKAASSVELHRQCPQ